MGFAYWILSILQKHIQILGVYSIKEKFTNYSFTFPNSEIIKLCTN